MGTKIVLLILTVGVGWLAHVSGTSTTASFLAELSDAITTCGEAVCHEETEVCNEGTCQCKPHFEGSIECVPCPGEGQPCRGCCVSNALTCYLGVCHRCSVDSNGNCISQESLFFLTAAQVALATAMVLGVISLSFLLYKTLRNRLRRNSPVIESEFRQSAVSRVSLSSIQQRVVRRLRDRPPKYETRHNYEYQQRQTEQRQNSEQNVPNEEDQQRSVVPQDGPPPAYDGDTVSLAENPPPYTESSTQAGRQNDGIAVITITSTNTSSNSTSNYESTNCDSSGLQGITNPTFEPDKSDPPSSTIQDSNNNVTDARHKDGFYDIPLVNRGDKTVYM
ncbi:uncharacterized protein LOC128731108 [Anopheles nili]|uniref:uncharacterized protein LOC128731108 n=1 Tax=Anopheles nili TaxID=185578 RepID=UPI00237C2DDB|nr:uncharacterized protein LOC128731108 [Anopheles nili]XP_053680181.1 uncharacterized protein LOC128731108 [Anopheles nili]